MNYIDNATKNYKKVSTFCSYNGFWYVLWLGGDLNKTNLWCYVLHVAIQSFSFRIFSQQKNVVIHNHFGAYPLPP